MAFPITPYRLRRHSAHTSWGPPSIRQWSVALTCRLTLFEPSKLKPENTQRPWPPRLTRRRVTPAFQPKHAGLKLALGDVPTRFAHIARRFDLSVIGQFERDRDHRTTNIVIEAALFESGRPVLIVPFIQKDRLKLDHVMVCWDGSRAAARAIADAMPFLTRSGKTSIIVADTQSAKSTDLPGADIATHLTRHGVNATIERIPVSKIDVSNTILSYAADAGADLIVMGGYGHSRLREFILGGTTRGMLASMTKPTLMSH